MNSAPAPLVRQTPGSPISSATEIPTFRVVRVFRGPSRRRAARAFTLVELLLVLVILGILAALVLPKFTGRTEQARITAAQTQISSFGTALDAFEVDTGTYPRGAEGLNSLIAPPAEVTNWRGPYLKDAIPMDPWGKPYLYEFPGRVNPSGYDIRSAGPDGQPNTADDVVNSRVAPR